MKDRLISRSACARALIWVPIATFCIQAKTAAVIGQQQQAKSQVQISLKEQPNERVSFCVKVDRQTATRLLGANAGTTTELSQLFQVFVIPKAEGQPALLGEYSVSGSELSFVPDFPMRAGVTYRARFHTGESGEPAIEKDFSILKGPSSPTQVEAVFPLGPELPENLLKMYFYFSAPMSRGEVYQYIHLLDAEGQELEASFLELPQELWDAEATRFTLLFDPGRIKRGLVPNKELGAPLVGGQSYTLVIDERWPDANGRPLREGVRKTFLVTASDRTPPHQSRWTIEPPDAGSRDALAIQFDEPMDRGMLEHSVLVRDAGGVLVEGEVLLPKDRDDRWEFRPGKAWRAAKYKIEVDVQLEDRAGNNLIRAFDVQGIADADLDSQTPRYRVLEFHPR